MPQPKVALLILCATIISLVYAIPANDERGLFSPVCLKIQSSISRASSVYYFGHPLYLKGRHHWATSSAQNPLCVVEPGTAADVGVVLTIVGSTRTPFAVKGGGHASNPKFSSTSGVHISMYRFSGVKYDASTQTAEVGAGLLWDDVYAKLAPFNVNVVGGRVPGVGVAGFTLGGGYSWKTNQYGLTIDTVVAFELVKPNGNVVTVTDSVEPQLFSALKGSLNNFGIVTKFTFKTFPQSQVWGGLITYTAPFIPAVARATAAFQKNVNDPKAGIITTYNFLLGSPGIAQLIFYDGPSPPPGIFDDFLKIPFFTKDIKTRSFLSLIKSAPANLSDGLGRAIFNTVSLLEYTPSILNVILNETIFWGSRLSLKTAVLVSYDVEPFLPSIYTHNNTPSAFPPTRAQGFSPFNIYFAWELPLFDSAFHEAARASAAQIRRAAIQEGQAVASTPVYPNYAIFDTSVSSIYGGQLEWLRGVKAEVDPGNVMGLAGGFKI